MKLLKFLKWLLPKSKTTRRNEALMREYNMGRYLRVGDDTDNKKLFLELEAKNGA